MIFVWTSTSRSLYLEQRHETMSISNYVSDAVCAAVRGANLVWKVIAITSICSITNQSLLLYVYIFAFIRIIEMSINVNYWHVMGVEHWKYLKEKYCIDSSVFFGFRISWLTRITSSAAITFSGRAGIPARGSRSIWWMILKTSLRFRLDRSFSGFLYFKKLTLKQKWLIITNAVTPKRSYCKNSRELPMIFCWGEEHGWCERE